RRSALDEESERYIECLSPRFARIGASRVGLSIALLFVLIDLPLEALTASENPPPLQLIGQLGDRSEGDLVAVSERDIDRTSQQGSISRQELCNLKQGTSVFDVDAP